MSAPQQTDGDPARGTAPDASAPRAVITDGSRTDEITRDPVAAALRAAHDLRVVVALKGGETIVAEPGGLLHRYSRGHVGLATSGSGDTLAGVVAGLAARGASPAQAAVWAVFLHGEAGNALARRLGRVGYLARELLDEIPAVMARTGG